MKFTSTLAAAWLGTVLGLLGLGASPAAVQAGDAKFEAQLVWATNDGNPPDEKYKPADEATQKKLESLGLKWKHFYVVKQVTFEAAKGDSGKQSVSDKCSISVKVLEDKKVEVIFYGKKGEECSRRVQTLKRGEMLVHGGKIEDSPSAWLVTLERLK